MKPQPLTEFRRMSRVRRLFPLALLALAGCGASDAPLPSGQEARTAVEATLEAWKSGQKPASLAERKPAIDAVDHEWAQNKALDAYAIGKAADGQGNKSFTVTLTLKGASAKDVTYMVFGRDPVHVYRDEDFARMSNMENGPVPPKKGR